MAVNQISDHLRSAVTEWALVPWERYGEAPSGWCLVWCRTSSRDFIQKQPAGFCLHSCWMCLVQQLRSDVIVLLIKHLQTGEQCMSASVGHVPSLDASVSHTGKVYFYPSGCKNNCMGHALSHLQSFKTVSCVNNLGWKKVNKVKEVSFKIIHCWDTVRPSFVKCKTILM